MKKILCPKQNGWEQKYSQEAYGITIAPSNEIARPVAPFPLRSGTKSPLTTSEAFGLEYPSSTKKQVAIKNTRNAIRNSSLRTCTRNKNYTVQYEPVKQERCDCYLLINVFVLMILCILSAKQRVTSLQ